MNTETGFLFRMRVVAFVNSAEVDSSAIYTLNSAGIRSVHKGDFSRDLCPFPFAVERSINTRALHK
jgi:hypothetical protein